MLANCNLCTLKQMASYYVSFFLFLLPLLLLLKLFKSSGLKSKNRYRLPPGPWRLPVIGSIHHFVGRGLAHHALCTLSQRYGHLMFLQLGELQTVVVSSKEAAREVLKEQDLNFCTRTPSPTIKVITYDATDISFSPYGEYWRQIRKICVLELLTTKQVQSFRSIREDEVKTLIQHIQLLSSTKQLVNLSEGLFNLANDITLRAIMGRKTKNQELFMREIHKIMELGAGFSFAHMFPSSRLVEILTRSVRRAEESHFRMDQILQNILTEQSGKEADGDGDAEDMLTVLLRLHAEGSANNLLSMKTVRAIIFDAFTGGSETSSSTIDWAMAELMRNPRVLKKAQSELRRHRQECDNITESDIREMHYVHLIIKETLRLHPVLPLLLPRECRETCKVQGYDIPKGTTVIVNAWALGRDSNYWKDAEEFRPERFAEGKAADMNFNGGSFEFIPFGSGRRICPGMGFGLATVEVVLANLLYHFDWELPHGMAPHQLDMTEAYSITARRNYPLCLRPIPYKNK